MHSYRTFDSTIIVDSHPTSTPKLYVPYSTSSESLESFQPYSTYSVANNNEIYGILSETSDKVYTDSEEILAPNNSSNCEIENSHVNYQFLYDSISNLCDSNSEINSIIWPSITTADTENSIEEKICCVSSLTASEESILSARDIEQCLMQIERSLVNIEQNLRLVHDLKIPQLNNCLYKRNNDDKDRKEDLKHVICDINNLDRPSSENCVGLESSIATDKRLSRSDNDINIDSWKDFNYNSSRVLPLNDSPNETFKNSIKNNSKQCNSQKSEADMTNRNLNIDNGHESNKSFQCSKNSLDEKNNSFLFNKQKASLNNYFCKGNMPMINSRKTSSQGALENLYAKESLQTRKKCQVSSSRHSINVHSSGSILDEKNAILDTLCKKVKATNGESPCSSKVEFKTPLSRKCTEKTFVQRGDDTVIEEKILINNHKQAGVGNKMHLLQSSDSTIVPTKLMSLSFSLLLAALLQAVRCLADLVEDTFRSITFGKYALHD